MLSTDNKIIKFNTTLPESAKQSLSLNSYSGFNIPRNHRLITIMDDLIDIFDKVADCEYKGEHYSARDNGAVMRHPKTSNRPVR